MQDLLSQEEIDALLHGVEGAFSAADDAEPEQREVVPYELSGHRSLQRGAWPGLELVNERFARQLRSSLFKLFNVEMAVSVDAHQRISFEDFQETLNTPSSITLLSCAPLTGKVLLVLDTHLVFKFVELFFGGSSGPARIAGHQYTALEQRVIDLFLTEVGENIAYAWRPLVAIEPQQTGAETLPRSLSDFSPDEPLVVCSFQLGEGGSGGQLQLALPYLMLAPLQDRLENGLASNADTASTYWRENLHSSIQATRVTMSCSVNSEPLSFRDVLNLDVGDIIPLDSSSVMLQANKRALYRASLADLSGGLSVQLQGRIQQ